MKLLTVTLTSNDQTSSTQISEIVWPVRSRVCDCNGGIDNVMKDYSQQQALNTRETGSGFICIYTFLYVCGVIISVRRGLNFECVR